MRLLLKDKLFIFFLSLQIAADPIIVLGTGPNAFVFARILALVFILPAISGLFCILIWNLPLLAKLCGGEYIGTMLLAVLSYPLFRVLFDPSYDISEKLTNISFYIIIPSSIYFVNLIRRYKIPLLFPVIRSILFPTIVVGSVVLTFYSGYLQLSWFILNILFPVASLFIVVFSNTKMRVLAAISSMKIHILIVFLIFSALVIAYQASSLASRTMIGTSLLYILLIIISFLARYSIVSKVIAMLVLIAFLAFIPIHNFLPIANFAEKNLQSTTTQSSLIFGLSNSREGVLADLFSQNFQQLLLGNGGNPWFSISHEGGSYRGGIEGFFPNLILQFGLIYFFFLAVLFVRSFLWLFFIHKSAFTKAQDNHLTQNLLAPFDIIYNPSVAILALIPLVFQSFIFYNPSASFSFLYFFGFLVLPSACAYRKSP